MTNKLGLCERPVLRPRRPYRLTRAGLRSLRVAIRRSQPWTRSTGPKTDDGKARVRTNALRHGLRSAAATALRKVVRKTIEELTDGAADKNPRTEDCARMPEYGNPAKASYR